MVTFAHSDLRCYYGLTLIAKNSGKCKEMRYLLSRNRLALGNIRDGILALYPQNRGCSQEEMGMRWGCWDLGSWVEQPRTWGWSLRESVYSPKSMPTLAWGGTNEPVFGAGRRMGFSASGEDFSVKHKSGRSITAHGRDSGEGASELRLGVSPPAN